MIIANRDRRLLLVLNVLAVPMFWIGGRLELAAWSALVWFVVLIFGGWRRR
jgi:hypothetical protein